MKALQQLEALALENNRKQYPDFPDNWRPKFKYSDKTANGLTKCIIDWIRFTGGQAERISVTGRMIDNTKVVTDCIGGMRKIGSTKYIPSSMQRGSADISSTIPIPIPYTGKFWGLSAKWEVKMKDKQSEAQKEYEIQVTRAGGYYFIVHSFDEFIGYYNQLLRETPF